MIVLTLVCYRPREDELAETFRTLATNADDFASLLILSSGTLESHALVGALAESHLPGKYELFRRYDNLGFSGGHNLLLATAFEAGATCGVVINPDLEFAPGAIAALSRQVLTSHRMALVGPALSRETGSGRVVDSLGIEWTPDARHVDMAQGEPWFPGNEPVVRQGITGACLAVSREAHQRIVDFDGEFFDVGFIAYREDAELGIRAAVLGVPSVVVPVDGIAHRRAVVNKGRSSSALINRLSVQNRLLMKWKLARFRPGSPILGRLRDVLVVGAAATIERDSWEGVRAAYRVRRYYRARGKSLARRPSGKSS